MSGTPGPAVSVRGFPPDALPVGEPVQAQHWLALEPVPQLVALARDFVRQHVPVLTDDTYDTVLLLTSELVTNAVLHARTALEVGITVTPRSLVVTVFDLDLGHRELPSPEVREGGRGLVLVTALAHAWAVHRPTDGGKTVWFRVGRDEEGAT